MGVSGAFWKHLGASGARVGLLEPSARARVGARLPDSSGSFSEVLGLSGRWADTGARWVRWWALVPGAYGRVNRHLGVLWGCVVG